jgi:hypothetical protein
VSFVTMLLTATLAWAQAGTAGVAGTVKDSQGAVVPGATVTATNQSLGTTRTTTSNAEGAYSIPGLPPGDYTLKVELTGFRTFVHEQVTLRVDTITTVDAVMSLGSLSETVTVSEATPIVNTTDASVGNTMNRETIERLPVEGRNVVHLLSLQPGAVFIPTANANTTDPRYGAVSGSRADQQNVTLDGIDVNDPQLQAAYTSAVRMTQEALQEFKVSTSNYGADAGRSSGAQVSLVTRSGTNQYDGSAYGFVRRTATSSDEYFHKLAQLQADKTRKPKAPKLDKNIFGGALGGPVRRNRTFVFGNYEGLQENSETPVTRAVPSETFRDGVLMYQCAVASDCPGGTVQGFASSHPVKAGWYGLSPQQIAAIDPLGIGPSVAASTLFKKYPLPNAPGLDNANIMDYLFAAPIENRFHTFIGRVDHRLAANHTLFARMNAQDDTINSPPQFEGQPSATQTKNKNMGFAIGYDAALSPGLVNSLRYGLTRIDSSALGQVKANYVTFRFISSLDPITFNSSRETPTQNIVDDLSWLRGTHTLKVGTNIRFTRIPTQRESGSWLNTSINPSWVGGVGQTYRPGGPNCTTPGCFGPPAVANSFRAGYADSWLNLLGVLSQANLNANYDKNGNLLAVGEPVARKFASDEYEWYVQDSWRIGSTLTLNGGIRYSLYSPPYEVNGLQVAPSTSMGQWFKDRAEGMLKGVPSNKSPIVTFDLAGPKNGKKGFYDWDKNNWAPRISAAWTPHPEHGLFAWLTGKDRTVIRGGYSKVFDRIGQGLATNFDQGFAFGMATSISSPFGAPYEANAGARFVDVNTMPPTMPVAPKGGFPQTPPLHAGIITSSIDDTLVTPSAHMANLLVSRELGGSYAIEGGYVGRFGRDLLIRRDIAMPLNLVDTKSGMDYFTAAQSVIRATQAAGIPAGAAASAYQAIANIPYWENLFPDAAQAFPGVLSATQAFARSFNRNAPDYITTLYDADESCSPGCSVYGPFAYFAEQYDSLAAISSLGRSNYHAMVLTLRKRHTRGLQFDVNYTLSHSKDMGSNVERGSAFGTYGAGGYSGFLINSFDPELNYGTSDFDVRHQINTDWIYDLPFGQGRRFGGHAGGFMNQLIGDWSIAGLMRWTSGFPFNVQNCRSCWPTNWNLQGNASLVTPGVLPETRTTLNAVDGRPSPFADAAKAAAFFRYDMPGEPGIRNALRGDGYFTIDTSVSKAWRIVADNRIRFRWDVFNVTNTPKFNVGDATMTPDRTGFGRYNSTLAACDAQAGRCMQFALRYEF